MPAECMDLTALGLLLQQVKAYELALNLQVDCIEIDASRTRDGVLVALHDRSSSYHKFIAYLAG